MANNIYTVETLYRGKLYQGESIVGALDAIRSDREDMLQRRGTSDARLKCNGLSVDVTTNSDGSLSVDPQYQEPVAQSTDWEAVLEQTRCEWEAADIFCRDNPGLEWAKAKRSALEDRLVKAEQIVAEREARRVRLEKVEAERRPMRRYGE
jgi:hypothetical protein